jgi:hypothetical protein
MYNLIFSYHAVVIIPIPSAYPHPAYSGQKSLLTSRAISMATLYTCTLTISTLWAKFQTIACGIPMPLNSSILMLFSQQMAAYLGHSGSLAAVVSYTHMTIIAQPLTFIYEHQQL